MLLTKEKKVFLLKRDGMEEPDRKAYKSVSHLVNSNWYNRDRIPKTGCEIVEYELVEVGRIPIEVVESRLPKRK